MYVLTVGLPDAILGGVLPKGDILLLELLLELGISICRPHFLTSPRGGREVT